MRMRIASVVVLTLLVGGAVSVGPAAAWWSGSGTKSCVSPRYAVTKTWGIGNHSHKQTYAGVTKEAGWYTSSVAHRTYSNGVRVLSYWWVHIDTEVNGSSGNGATCEL